MDERIARYSAWVLAPDLPPERVPPSASYFVCATPRTGSWLLSGLLASTGVAGQPHEWFLPAMEERNRRAWGAGDYLDLVRFAGTTPNGVFGAKAMWTSWVPFVAGGHLDRFPHPRFVWLRRHDARAQALSWASAIESGVWAQWDEPGAAPGPAADREQVQALERCAREHDLAWARWFAGQGVDPLEVAYEDLVADPAGTGRRVLRFLGLTAERMTPLTLSSAAYR